MPCPNVKPTTVGLVFLHSLAYYRRALRGVWRYVESQPHWQLLSIFPEENSLRGYSGLPLDGLIVSANTKALDRALTALRLPLVNVSAVIRGQSYPRVGVDNVQVGELAATHFVERGVRHFAFVGPPDQLFAVERRAAFCQALLERGHTVECYISKGQQEFDPLGLHWDLEADVQGWLKKLPKPVGVFAPTDLWAVQVLIACRQADLKVPEDVAILGVDNDTLYCEMTRPRLSSVIVPAEQIGYEAAALLHRLLGGESPPSEPLLLPPAGVHCRSSTEVLAIDDPQVVAAVRFIREQAHRPLQVEDVLEQIPIGRRTLERRFSKFLGWGVSEEIRRAHLNHARQLLAATDLTVQAVAIQSGYEDYRQLTRVFRRHLNTTPSGYREQVRGLGS